MTVQRTAESHVPGMRFLFRFCFHTPFPWFLRFLSLLSLSASFHLCGSFGRACRACCSILAFFLCFTLSPSPFGFGCIFGSTAWERTLCCWPCQCRRHRICSFLNLSSFSWSWRFDFILGRHGFGFLWLRVPTGSCAFLFLLPLWFTRFLWILATLSHLSLSRSLYDLSFLTFHWCPSSRRSLFHRWGCKQTFLCASKVRPGSVSPPDSALGCDWRSVLWSWKVQSCLCFP